ncbi:hypothetical protein HZH66_006076 [Vespula vulgaris]|uniref:Uncharacterized protein n=1 Tax=Vespula vulgaris TaxID=7454 RepID=A0A834N985_VESVU|nr:hypothetical protein HZH66_006076 [Vespula vulgaris]
MNHDLKNVIRVDERFAYHYSIVQELFPTDYRKRVEFCNWYMNAIERDNFFFMKNLFYGQTKRLFIKRSIFNSRNNHVWENKHNNPYFTIKKFSTQNFDVMFRWICLLIIDLLIDSFFLSERLNGLLFQKFLSNDLLQFCQNSWI